MRTLVSLKAQKEQSYNPSYHHKLRGVIWDNLSETKHESLHGDRNTVPFSFSNPFPVKDMKPGEERKFIVSSSHYELIDDLADSFREQDEIHIGNMSFNVDSVTTFGVDVGEPGSRGLMKSATGIYLPIWEDEWDDLGITVPYNTDSIGWTEDYDNKIFLKKVAENLDWKQDVLYGEYLNSPSYHDLFDGISRNKTYSVETKVSSDNGGYDYTFVVTKWNFKYRVRNDDHRRWLNILLESGIGWRNALGFGFLNKVVNNE